MVKSKRNKIVHLTQVKKKGKDHKDDLMKQLEQFLKDHNHIYLFDFEQTKSDRIMNLRVKLKSSGRIFAGRHSLVSLTFKTVGSEQKIDYSEFLKHFVGHKGILFTNLKCDQLIKKLEDEVPDFCDKLIGYSKLPNINGKKKSKNIGKASGDDADLNDDDDDEDDDDEEEDGDEGKKTSKTKSKRNKKKVPPNEVEFILLQKTKRVAS